MEEFLLPRTMRHETVMVVELKDEVHIFEWRELDDLTDQVEPNTRSYHKSPRALH